MGASNILGFDEWREAIAQSLVAPIELSTKERAFLGSVSNVPMGEGRVLAISADSHAASRCSSAIPAGTPAYYVVNMITSGCGLLVQDGREVLLSHGELAIYNTNRPYSLSFDGSVTSISFVLPKELVESATGDVSDLTAVRLTGTFAATAFSVLRTVAEQVAETTAREQRRLLAISADVVGIALSSHLTSHPTTRQSARRQRLAEIRAYIDESLGDDRLSPSQIAAHHYLSVRHLHTLFAEEQQTVASYIRSRRLAMCQRDLADPLLLHLPVAAIAARWGLTEPAYFSRVFRSEFAETPSEYRQRQLTAVVAA